MSIGEIAADFKKREQTLRQMEGGEIDNLRNKYQKMEIQLDDKYYPLECNPDTMAFFTMPSKEEIDLADFLGASSMVPLIGGTPQTKQQKYWIERMRLGAIYKAEYNFIRLKYNNMVLTTRAEFAFRILEVQWIIESPKE